MYRQSDLESLAARAASELAPATEDPAEEIVTVRPEGAELLGRVDGQGPGV